MSGIDEEKLEEARSRFEQWCDTEYYLEWMWFPLQEKVWMNQWTGEPI